MTSFVLDPRLVRAARVAAAGLLLSAAVLLWTTSAGHAAGHSVAMSGNSFQPDTIAAAVGDVITWSNRDPETHSVVGGAINSPDITPGSTFSYTVSQAGDISYTCRFHPYMTGTIHVTGSGGAPAPTAPPATSPPATSAPGTAPPATSPPPTAAVATSTTAAAAADEAVPDDAEAEDDEPTAAEDDPEAIDDEDVDENVDSVAEDDPDETAPAAATAAPTAAATGPTTTLRTTPPPAAVAAFPADVTYVEPSAPVEEVLDNGPLTAATAAPNPTATTVAPTAVATTTTTIPSGEAMAQPALAKASATRRVGGYLAMTAALALVFILLFGRTRRESP